MCNEITDHKIRLAKCELDIASNTLMIKIIKNISMFLIGTAITIALVLL